ncbi:MAG: helix-turn-helix domain-containing protein [Austwickia sp.]|jgi:predicted ArsR family transcriptional regulator|nr:MAG: helix-turn-helix domain-containing protein [Austwickia sp.]
MSTVSRDDLLSSQVRRRIVDLIRESPSKLAAADLAGTLDLHVTTVRFHLDQLEQAGVLTAQRERRESVGRPRKVYAVAPETVPVNESAYVVLTGVLAEAIPGIRTERSGASIAAGAAWARRNVTAREAAAVTGREAELPVRELIDVLARWGYRRETVTVEQPRPGCHRLSLSQCPMREAAIENPDVVCAAHLGLIRGTLSRLGVADVFVRVQPMVTEQVCLVDLVRGQAGGALELSPPAKQPA